MRCRTYAVLLTLIEIVVLVGDRGSGRRRAMAAASGEKDELTFQSVYGAKGGNPFCYLLKVCGHFGDG